MLATGGAKMFGGKAFFADTVTCGATVQVIMDGFRNDHTIAQTTLKHDWQLESIITNRAFVTHKRRVRFACAFHLFGPAREAGVMQLLHVNLTWEPVTRESPPNPTPKTASPAELGATLGAPNWPVRPDGSPSFTRCRGEGCSQTDRPGSIETSLLKLFVQEEPFTGELPAEWPQLVGVSFESGTVSNPNISPTLNVD
ncbi:hypothetical protein PAPYR_11841 [Paratrimastix pyriformis]|uniref:Dirigent protein n=1 Tax=Paratrimastix pyriformis TaxID=342808 RepID=A0ABQ8U7P7_9EUKA|nr:hypothetical protein PAPYR_11841 [Paratrimastix pyriformis]